MTPEGKVKKDIRKFLDAQPYCWYYMPMQNGMGRTGIPDFIINNNGLFVAIETKAPGGNPESKLTANQRREIEGIRKARGTALVVNDVEDVAEIWAGLTQYMPERIMKMLGREMEMDIPTLIRFFDLLQRSFRPEDYGHRWCESAIGLLSSYEEESNGYGK